MTKQLRSSLAIGVASTGSITTCTNTQRCADHHIPPVGIRSRDPGWDLHDDDDYGSDDDDDDRDDVHNSGRENAYNCVAINCWSRYEVMMKPTTKMTTTTAKMLTMMTTTTTTWMTISGMTVALESNHTRVIHIQPTATFISPLPHIIIKCMP